MEYRDAACSSFFHFNEFYEERATDCQAERSKDEGYDCRATACHFGKASYLGPGALVTRNKDCV
jgi:hypothetical protein